MNLFRKIKEVLPALECPKKFSLKDPIKPEADRTDSFLVPHNSVSIVLAFSSTNYQSSGIFIFFWARCCFSMIDLCSKVLKVKTRKMNLLRPMVKDLTLLDEKRQQLEGQISQLNA